MRKKIFPTLIILTSALLVVSCCMIISTIAQSNAQIDAFEELADIVQPTTEATDSEVPDETNPNLEPSPKPIFTRNLTPLFDKNSDCLGWICVPGTNIDYPFMHTPSEPHKYLKKNFDGKYSAAGVPFLQENNTLDSDNLIIYGHNMKNGTMFADIIKYRNKSYCTEHPTIELETKQGLKLYDVFAVVKVKNNDAWYHFIEAVDESDYRNKVEEINSRALYDTGITPQYGQQLITLSTCYGSTKNDRIIVIGVEVSAEGRK